MSKILVPILIIVAIIAGIIVFNKKPAQTNPAMSNGNSSSMETTNPEANSVNSSVKVTTTSTDAGINVSIPQTKKFTVNASDENADLKMINVNKGDVVELTFNADKATTYHGGLDFRSSVKNTGTVMPGQSKTITFIADSSFSFTPYWPESNIKKPYTIDIVVK